jgi:hypothetical protein
MTDEAARMFLQWVGSAGALSYMELAEQARAAEALLFKPGWTWRAWTAAGRVTKWPRGSI